MYYKLIISFFTILFLHCAHAKKYTKLTIDPYEDGRQSVIIGYGYQSYFKLFSNVPSNILNYNIKDNFLLFVKYDKCMLGKLSGGFSTGYASQSIHFKEPDSLGVGYNSFNGNRYALNIMLRANLHFYTNSYIDLYGGLGAGLRYTFRKYYYTPHNTTQKPKTDISSPSFFPFTGELTFGFRFKPIKYICLYSELGLTQSIVQAGIVLSFKGKTTHVRGTFI